MNIESEMETKKDSILSLKTAIGFTGECSLSNAASSILLNVSLVSRIILGQYRILVSLVFH
jgi:hypothetical protein